MEIIPTSELWLHSNPQAISTVVAGLADCAAGRVVDGGDFTQYLDDSDED